MSVERNNIAQRKGLYKSYDEVVGYWYDNRICPRCFGPAAEKDTMLCVYCDDEWTEIEDMYPVKLDQVRIADRYLFTVFCNSQSRSSLNCNCGNYIYELDYLCYECRARQA